MTRMSLSNVLKGKLNLPKKVGMYSEPGVGKSTFAAGAPSPIFLCGENGTASLDVARLPIVEKWSDVVEALNLLYSETHEYKTLVIDPVNWLEGPLATHVCAGTTWKTLSEYGGGYNKGADAAMMHWMNFLSDCERLIAKGMNVVFLAHARVKKRENPISGSWDRYEIAMTQAVGDRLRGWCDYWLFARHEVYADTTTKRGMSTGRRIVHTQQSHAFDAKARGGALFPDTFALSWPDFETAISVSGGNVVTAIEEAITKLPADKQARARDLLKSARGNVAAEIGLLKTINERIGANEQA